MTHKTLRWMIRAAVILVAILASSSCTTMRPERIATRALAGCSYTTGTGLGWVYTGKMILEGGTARDGALYVTDGLIRDIDSASAVAMKYPSASRVTCEHAYLTPGFINPHEHTSYSYGFPDPLMKPIYTHRDEWRLGLNGKYKIVEPASTSDKALLAWVELRHLVTGVTTVAASGAVPGIVKNVGSPNQPEVYTYQVDLETFPFGTTAMKDFVPYACNPEGGPAREPHVNTDVPTTLPYVGHVGEGTSCEATLELDFFLDYVAAHPGRKYTLIHGVALNSKHLTNLVANHVSVVWSPRSNLALYGKTVDPTWLIDSGVPVALGTDWSPSGSYTQLEEIHCARDFTQKHATRALTGLELWSMSTIRAAEALGIADRTGSIAVGKAADLAIINDPTGQDLADIASLTPADVLAVFVDGTLLSGQQNAITGEWINSHCLDAIDGKVLCVNFAPLGLTFDALRAKNSADVDLVSTAQEAGCETAALR